VGDVRQHLFRASMTSWKAHLVIEESISKQIESRIPSKLLRQSTVFQGLLVGFLLVTTRRLQTST
jgi:hypothetical protein